MLIAAPGLISGIRLGLNANVVGSNCNISTSQAKFGRSSLDGGTSSYANVSPVTNFVFGTGNFTIEFWYYTPTPNSQVGILGFRPQSTNGAYISLVGGFPSSGNVISLYANNGTRITTAANSIVANTWTSVALVRNSGNTRIYLNGTQSGNTYVDSTNYLASRLILASDDFNNGSSPILGFIDELRISNVARYTGTYTPSNQPFIDDGNTCLLYHFDQDNGSRNLVDDNS
jgi:hypothetical protein